MTATEIIDIINNILFWVCLYALLWNAYFLLFNKGIPNIRTAKAIRNKMVEILRRDFEEKRMQNPHSPYVIVDPGCGNGALTRHIAREIPEAHVVGVEISRIAYWRCLLGKKLDGLQNIRYENCDFRDFDFRQTDAVAMFLLGSLMMRIRPKFEEELKPGTLILANRFPLGGDWQPQEVHEIKTIAINQKTLYMYRKS